MLNVPLFGSDLLADLEAKLIGAKEKATRIKLEAQIAILKNGGKAEFLTLCDLEGNPIAGAELCNFKYGECFRLPNKTYVNHKTSEKTLAKKGYTLKREIRTAWATEKFGKSHVYMSDFNYWTMEVDEG